MQRMSVKSTCFKSIGFDPEKKVLELEFTDGGVCQYKDVPDFKYLTLLNAKSMEKYFKESIENKFKCVKKN